jgi:nanoRNase/pAp phosphatase (c-di-AMP/oligoRNAs hydrolase)
VMLSQRELTEAAEAVAGASEVALACHIHPDGDGGGGHRFAAGFTCSGTVPEVLAAIRAALPAS